MADYSTRRGGLRARLPLQVLRGFYPTEPTKLSSLAEPLNVNDIKSGMVIVKDGDGKWIQAEAADAIRDEAAIQKAFYIALTDADALDVQASGKLVGLDCSDSYELQSGYFDKSVVWAVGDQLTVGADGTFVKATAHATSITQVIGEITAVGPDVAGGAVGNPIAYVGMTPSCPAADAWMIQFKTVDRNILPVTVD